MFGRHNKLNTEWLESVSFFADFTKEEVEEVASLGEREEVKAGSVLVDQGRFGDHCYVIVEGSANVSISGEYVTTVCAGSMVGEMALVEHRPRNASVVAETDMVVVSFGIKEFNELLDRSPHTRTRVQTLLNKRAVENTSRD